MLAQIARALAVAASVSTLCASVALAQHPSGAHHGAQKSHHPNIIGTWEGTFQMQSKGGMELVVERDSVWHVKMQLIVDHPFPPVDVRDFTVDGKTVTWVSDLMGTACKAKANLDESNAMKGEMVCDARTLTFSLTKKS